MFGKPGKILAFSGFSFLALPCLPCHPSGDQQGDSLYAFENVAGAAEGKVLGWSAAFETRRRSTDSESCAGPHRFFAIGLTKMEFLNVT